MILRIINVVGISTLVTASFVNWMPIVSGALASTWAILLIGEWFGLWRRPGKW